MSDPLIPNYETFEPKEVTKPLLTRNQVSRIAPYLPVLLAIVEIPWYFLVVSFMVVFFFKDAGWTTAQIEIVRAIVLLPAVVGLIAGISTITWFTANRRLTVSLVIFETVGIAACVLAFFVANRAIG